jgi:hypothetical protein
VGASCFTLALNESSEKGPEIGVRTPALSVDGKSFTTLLFVLLLFTLLFRHVCDSQLTGGKKILLTIITAPHCQLESSFSSSSSSSLSDRRRRRRHHHHHLAGKNRTWC